MIEKLTKEKNYIETIKAISKDKCNRCNSNILFKDNYGVYHCLECYNYGDITSEDNIYRYVRKIENIKHIVNLKFKLTKKQLEGSKFLVDCYSSNKAGYLQAVCGAGKTEMTYQVILTALNKNERVCLVLPRVEVLKEVSKRFKRDFPETKISVLYEGNKEYSKSSLILSTPQQLIYFYQEFDLMIIDEVDAFPYSSNLFLERLVIKSLKENGVILYMSATISKNFEKLINKGYIKRFTIPERYHQKDLIVPTFIKSKDEKHLKNILSTKLFEYIKIEKQCLIFVPSIKLGKLIKEYLTSLNIMNNFIFSQKKYKLSIIKEFRRKDYLFLITTTILERGVTFENIDCIVLNSDNLIFNKETLIQISGRVGRSIKNFNGKVIFISKYISSSMNEAKKEIKEMNRRKNNEMYTLW